MSCKHESLWAESALDAVIQATRCQRESDGRNNAALVRDKAALQDCVREMQAQLSGVQAQVRERGRGGQAG